MINLTQTARTATSVTFSVSGITDDRQTFIWMPLLGTPDWITLATAYSLGYISSYSASGGNNGTITVNFYASDTVEFKVWEFQVGNFISGNPTAWSSVLDAILKFEWDGAATKYTGNDIDITVDDLRRLNNFGSYINAWIIGGEGSYWDLVGIVTGDGLWNEYIRLPIQNIHDTAYGLSSSILANRSNILSDTSNILDLVYEGEECYALYFNDIKSAINNFNLSI